MFLYALSLSQSPRKQSGFTLVELMVVMAIIAILATAGLSAYTGYIKKARDATRIVDIRAINTIILGMISSTGMPPQSALVVYNLVKDTNNGTILMDPLASNNGLTTTSVCFGATTAATGKECSYTYRVCDSGMGYAVGTRFESASNIPLYLTDNIPTAAHASWDTNAIFEIGSCQASCAPALPTGCPAGPGGYWTNTLPTKINSDVSQWIGSG